MKFSRKNVLRLIFISAAAVIIIPFVITTTNLDIYGCVSKADYSCDALNRAGWKTEFGLILLTAAWLLLIFSISSYLYLIAKKHR